MQVCIVFDHVASNHFEFLLLNHLHNLFELDQKCIFVEFESRDHNLREKLSGSKLTCLCRHVITSMDQNHTPVYLH